MTVHSGAVDTGEQRLKTGVTGGKLMSVAGLSVSERGKDGIKVGEAIVEQERDVSHQLLVERRVGGRHTVVLLLADLDLGGHFAALLTLCLLQIGGVAILIDATALEFGATVFDGLVVSGHDGQRFKKVNLELVFHLLALVLDVGMQTVLLQTGGPHRRGVLVDLVDVLRERRVCLGQIREGPHVLFDITFQLLQNLVLFIEASLLHVELLIDSFVSLAELVHSLLLGTREVSLDTTPRGYATFGRHDELEKQNKNREEKRKKLGSKDLHTKALEVVHSKIAE
mmetsp:Transcript_50623/g.127154  ORF Transcript_50623/g.127154 Transcript_50623/m.127154 type:complete len:283 (-) Transcript_50623:79-927(-)